MSNVKNTSVGRRIASGIMSGAGYTAISIIVNFLLLRIILEYLSQELSGVWLLYITIGGYIAFFDLGISPTMSREIGFVLGNKELDQNSRNQKIADILATCVKIFKYLSVVVFIIGGLLGGLFLTHVASDAKQNEIIISWTIYCLGAAFNLYGGAWFASLYGLGHVATERIIKSFTLLLNLVLSILALHQGFGLIGLATVWTVQGIIARFIGLLYLKKYNPFLRYLKGIASREIFKKLALPSIKWATAGLGAILILQTDNLIIASSVGAEAIPKYEGVAKIITAIGTLSSLIISSSTPYITQSYSKNDLRRVITIMLNNSRYIMSFIVFLVSYLAIFGDVIIEAWLGPGMFVGYDILWTLLIMMTLEINHMVFASSTMATGRLVFHWIAIIAGVLNLVFSLILVRFLGLWGVALGTLLAQVITNNWYAPYYSLKLFKVSLSNYWNNTLKLVLLLLLFMIPMNLLMKNYISVGNSFVLIMIYFLLSTIIAGVFFFIIITKEERDRIKKIISSIFYGGLKHTEEGGDL